jgi:autotransporter-associated beta strand protein
MRSRTAARSGLRRLFAAACALAFLAAHGGATTLYEVTTNAGDNSAGSLGAALTSAIGAPSGNDVVLFNPYLSPVISPAGAYTTTANVLSLDGNQLTVNFAGGMTVAGGVLNVNGLTASGITVTGGILSTSYSTINGLILNGGTFQTRDNGATAGVTLIGAGSGKNTLDPAGNNPTFSGIAGAGDLTVADSVGGGIVTLNGANTYTGATFVNSGTLQLGLASALAAAGNLTTASGGVFDLNGFNQTLGTVVNNGTVKTGLGTLTVTNFSGGGTLSVALQSGVTNLVAGTAALGGPLAVTGHPALGAYTIVNAGTLTGTFSSAALPFGVTDTLTCNDALGTCVINVLSDKPFTFAGQSSNQASIAGALNLASYSATGDLGAVIASLSAMTPAQANAAMDQIGPINYAALTGMSFAGAGVQSAAVTQRLTGLQAGRGSPDGSRFASFAGGGAPYPGVLVAELPGDASAATASDKDRRFDPDARWGFFVAGLGTFDHHDAINGSAGAQPGYSVTATGETVGADYRYGEHFAAGLAAGYVNSFASIAQAGGTVYGQSVRLGVYGTVYNDEFHANLYVGGAHDFYDASRNDAAFGRTATSNPSGQEFNLNWTAGWDEKTAHADLSPFVGLAYDRMMLGSFTESGAGALDLAVDGQTAESLRSVLGVKVSRQFKPDWCDVTPYASAGWQHEFENQSRPLNAQLASGGTGSFTVTTADAARETLLLGAGLNMDWTPGYSTRLAYESAVSSDFKSNTFSGSMRWRF